MDSVDYSSPHIIIEPIKNIMRFQVSLDEKLHIFPNGEQEYIKDNHLGRWYINCKTSRLKKEMTSDLFDKIEVAWRAKLYVNWYFFKKDIKLAFKRLFDFK